MDRLHVLKNLIVKRENQELAKIAKLKDDIKKLKEQLNVIEFDITEKSTDLSAVDDFECFHSKNPQENFQSFISLRNIEVMALENSIELGSQEKKAISEQLQDLTIKEHDHTLLLRDLKRKYNKYLHLINLAETREFRNSRAIKYIEEKN